MIYALLFLPFLSLAGVVQDQVTLTDGFEFDFKTVCQKMASHESPLIEVVSGTVLDCMGKKIVVGDFCEKELAHDPYYLRGSIDQEKKVVICQSGKKVLFKYQCVRRADQIICAGESLASCQKIKLKLARRLDLVHHSFTKNKVGIKELNCFFESLPLSQRVDGSL